MGINLAFKGLKSVKVASSQFFSESLVAIPSYSGRAIETASLIEPNN